MSKTQKQPIVPKEFVWLLDIDGEEKLWKCVVGETECVTYEGDTERKHLKIGNPVRQEKVLQIDTDTEIYGSQTAFQLENGIPYIKLDGHWVMSDTTREDRLRATIQARKKKALMECIAAAAIFAIGLIKTLLTGELGGWWMVNVLGVFCLASSAIRMLRLKKELDAQKKANVQAEKASAED